MGRHRKADTDLPMRLFKHDALYRYVARVQGRPTITPLGRNRQKAIEVANKLNQLSRIERNEVVGCARTMNGLVRERIFERDSFQCVYCGTGRDLILDHFIPYSKGGATHADNLVTCCVACNENKADRSPVEFVAILAGIQTEIVEAAILDLFPFRPELPKAEK